jgi:hypothetical protein
MEEVEIFPLDPPDMGSDMVGASENSAEEIGSSDIDALPTKQCPQETCCGVCNSGASPQVQLDPGVVLYCGRLSLLSGESFHFHRVMSS